MSLLKKPFMRSKEDVQAVEADQYIDLGQLSFDEESPLGGKGMIKIAEIYRYEDLNPVVQPAYSGNVVIIDYSSIANDELTLKRITNELKAVARDTNGDVAAIGHNLIVVAPNGLKIDRHKIKGGYT